MAVSIGLAYGIAGAAAGLILLGNGLRENRNVLLGAGMAVLGMTLFLKAHIALVGVPLGIAWILCSKKGWSAKQRLTIGALLAGSL